MSKSQELKESFLKAAAESANLTPNDIAQILKSNGVAVFNYTKMNEYKEILLADPKYAEGFKRQELIKRFTKKEPLHERCPIPNCNGLKLRCHATPMKPREWNCTMNDHHYLAWRLATLRIVVEKEEDPNVFNKYMIDFANVLEGAKDGNTQKEEKEKS